MARRQPGGEESCNSKKNLAPAGNCGECGGALHGIANKAQIFGHIGGKDRGARLTPGLRGAVKAPGAMGSRIQHVAQNSASLGRCQVLCNTKLEAAISPSVRETLLDYEKIRRLRKAQGTGGDS